MARLYYTSFWLFNKICYCLVILTIMPEKTKPLPPIFNKRGTLRASLYFHQINLVGVMVFAVHYVLRKVCNPEDFIALAIIDRFLILVFIHRKN